MTAIPLLDLAQAPLLARRYLSPEGCSPLAAVLAHVPELLETAMPFLGTLYGPTALADRLKEIVTVRISAVGGCRYCTRVHGALAAAAGLLPAEIAGLGGQTEFVPTFTEEERAAIAFAEALCRRPAGSVALLRPHFRDDQIVELALLGATTISLNRFCTAMGLS